MILADFQNEYMILGIIGRKECFWTNWMTEACWGGTKRYYNIGSGTGYLFNAERTSLMFSFPKNGPQNIFRQDMKVSMEPKWISPQKSSR